MFSEPKWITPRITPRITHALHGRQLAEKTERYVTMLNLAAGDLSEADFAAWLRDNTAPA